MIGSCPVAVMMHAPCWQKGLKWYEEAFPDAIRCQDPGSDFEFLRIRNVILEVVQADEKVPVGAAGTVVYWLTDSFSSRLAFLQSIGATLYRGPMTTESGITMCQLKDPFGNSFGIRTA